MKAHFAPSSILKYFRTYKPTLHKIRNSCQYHLRKRVGGGRSSINVTKNPPAAGVPARAARVGWSYAGGTDRRFAIRNSIAALVVVGIMAAGFMVVSGRAAALGFRWPASVTRIFASRNASTTTTVRTAPAPRTISAPAVKPMAPLAVMLSWNTFGNAGTETTEPSTFNDANLSAVNLTLGTVTAAANGNRFGGSGWFDAGNTPAGNTLAEAIAGNDYIQFIVTPNAGFSFTPTSFGFNWDRSATGPSSVTLRSSADSFATDLGTVTGIAVGVFATNTITISGLTNLTTATTFRLYGYGATATAGTGGFDIGTNAVNVQLNGTTAAAPGTIRIVKDAVPDDAQDFSFTNNFGNGNPSSFALDDDADLTLSNTRDSVVTVGTYAVSEGAVAGWDLTSATCSDGSLISAIGVSAGETVICTFTNTKRGHVIVVKDAVPNDAQDFSFTNNFLNANPSPFLLDDDADGTLLNSRDSVVLPGTYAVSEAAVGGWTQTSATCSDGSPVSAIVVSPGETVTCTFVNTRQADLTITKTDSPDPVTEGNNLTYTITVHNNGPATATGVTMTDILPLNTTFVSLDRTLPIPLGPDPFLTQPNSFFDVFYGPNFFGPNSDPGTAHVLVQSAPTGALGNIPTGFCPVFPAGLQTSAPPFAQLLPLSTDPICGGPGLGQTDTIVRRTAGVTLPMGGPAVVIPIQIVALQLVSVQPITVTYSGGLNPEPWNVAVDLAPVTQPTGSMSATRTSDTGGTFNSTLPVLPRLTFTNTSPGHPPVAMSPNEAFQANGTFTQQTFNCSTPTVGTNGTVACTGGTLDSNMDVTFTLVVKPTHAAAGTQLSNTATTTANEPDPTTPNSATETTDVTAAETEVAVSGGNLTITDANGGNTDDTLTISLVGGNIRIHDPNHTLTAGAGATQVDANTVDVPLASITGNITVNTQGGNDTLTLDLSGGDFIPAGGVFFNGGAGGGEFRTNGPTGIVGDALAINGGSQGTVTYNYSNPNDGNVVMSNFGTVTYTGLEPISNSGTAADVVFNLPAGPNTDTALGDDGTAANGMSRLSGSTFEDTDFANPSGSLTINRGNVGDVLAVNTLPDFTASLTIGAAGTPFSTLNFNGALTLASNKHLAAFASGAISQPNANSDLSTSGTGTISLSTTRNITLSSGSSITTASGAIDLTANTAATSTGGFIGIDVNSATIGSTSGSITLNGHAGDTGVSQYGVQIRLGGVVGNGTTGTVMVTGVGGGSAGGSHGIVVIDSNGGGNSRITTSSSGNITVNGTGANSGAGTNSNYGIDLQAGGTLSAAGTGNISVTGTGGQSDSFNFGVLVVNTASTVNAVAGTVTIVGTGGSGASGSNDGVFLSNGVGAGNEVVAGGDISITATAGTGSSTGFRNTACTVRTTTTGNITVAADSMAQSGSINAQTRAVTLRQRTNGVAIDLGAATDPSGGPLGLTDAELDGVTAGTLNIGDANSGSITVSADISRPAGDFFNLISGANIDIAGGSLNTNGGDSTLAPGTNVFPSHSGVDVTTSPTKTIGISTGKDLKIVINSTTVDSGYTQLNVAGLVNIIGVNLVLSGSYTPIGGETFTIVNNDSTDLITGTFAGLPEGATITNFLGSGLNATITYVGGTNANDVVLTVACGSFATVYVDDSWVGTAPGTDPDGGGPATSFGCDSFATIQGGVDGVTAGGTVNVAAGTYTEQVSVNKNLTLTGAGAATTIIQAPAVMANDPDGAKTIVLFTGVVTDEISGFTIQGPVNGINFGIYARAGATVNIHDNTIKDIRDNPLSGNQNGYGIEIGKYNNTFPNVDQVGHATITNNLVIGYQKTGIECEGASSTATMTGNTVTGAGLISTIAQNGIQIRRGATGTIDTNTVTGNAWTGHANNAAGIIVTYPGTGVIIQNNIVNNNTSNIYTYEADAVQILNNQLTDQLDGRVMAGITADADNVATASVGITVTITGNTVKNNLSGGSHQGPGIFLWGVKSGTVSGNTVAGNGDDGLLIGASGNITITGNVFRGNGFNTFSSVDPNAAAIDFGGLIPELEGFGNQPNTLGGFSVHHNVIVGNKNGVWSYDTASTNVENNWWGCNAGPGQTGCDATGGIVDFDPWIVLLGSATPSTITPGGTSTVAADMTHNSAGAVPVGTLPNIPDSYSATHGTMFPTTGTIIAGAASSLFTSTDAISAVATITVDNQNTNVPITVNAPSFSIDDVTHLEGNGGPGSTAYLFTITKTGATALSSSVDYETVNGTATAPSDFTAITTTNVVFLPLETTKQFTVLVNGDLGVEPNEAFTVLLTNASGATIADNSGTGTVTNDDSCAAFATVYVDDSWVGTAPGTDPDAGGPATNFGCDSFATIQEGVNAVTSGGNVIVNAGTYLENVTIPKPLTLTGAGAATVFLKPATSDPNCGGGGGGSLCAGSVNLILVQADNVTISGLTLDGDNPALPGGINVGGANVDARNGIITNHLMAVYNNLEVHHTTVKNIYLRGMYASSGGTFNFHDNTVQNVQASVASIGMFNFAGAGAYTNNNVSACNDAISSNHSRGTTYTGNTVTTSASGIHTDNAGDSGGTFDTISGNTVTNSQTFGYGIWVFVPYKTVHINNNTVTNVDVGTAVFGDSGVTTATVPTHEPGDGHNPGRPAPASVNVPETGSALQRPQTPNAPASVALAASFTGNTVDGQNKPASTGVYFTTSQIGFGSGDPKVEFKSNTVINNVDGFYLEAETGFTLDVAASFNRIVNNTSTQVTQASGGGFTGTLNGLMENNWWGCNAGPNNAGCGTVVGAGVDFNPWLVLGTSASPNPIGPGGTSTVTADMTHNSAAAVPSLVDFVPQAGVSFTATQGTMTPPAGTITSGQATSLFTSTSLLSGTGCAAVDNSGAICTNITVTLPSFSIDDVTHLEGSPSGTTSYVFTVTKTGATTFASSVNFSTVNGTATLVDNDYQTNSGTLNFGPTDTTMPITVLVNKDTNVEPDEAFTVHLDTPVNATISDADGTGTITNDDACAAFATVYVDDNWVGTAPGTDPDGGGPATNFGCDSFATIQGGVNGVTVGGTVIVRPGTYPESVLINKALTLNGAQVGANANTRFAAFTAGGPPNGPKANPAVESVITAAAVNPTSNVNNPIHVMADNVTVDGFVIDGNNPALPAGGSVPVVGINTDARRGIETEDAAGAFFAANNVTVQNNVIQNFAQRGVELVNPTNTSPATTGSLIHGNVVRVFGLDGIVLAFNACADITNNTVDTPNYPTEAGIWLQDFGNGATPSAMTIANNNVTVGQDNFGGIWVNLAFLPSLNINNNTVNAASGVTGASDFTYGIYLSSQRPGSTASLSGNIVGASGGEFSRGIALWNLGSATPTTVTGGTVGKSLKGVSLHDNDPNFGLAGGNSAASMSGVSIDGTGVPTSFGVVVDANLSTGDTVAMEISGNTSIINTNTAIDVVGTNASANIHNNAASIHNNTIGIDVVGGTATITSNNLFANATGLQFGTGATVTAHFNRIISTTTAISNALNVTTNLENNWWGCNAGPGNAGCGAVTGTGADFDPWIVLGVSALPSSIPPFGNSTITADMTKNSAGATPVGTLPDIPVAWSATNGTMAPPSGTVVAGTASSTFTSTSTISGTGCATVDNQLTCANVTVFPTTVTIVPAPVPTAADNDYTRINNAVQATFNGQTIKLLGTFNWTEPFAAASWSRGSNDIGGDLDDYSILVPGNIPNVTFTADNLGDGTIQGPGDLPGLDLEGVFFFNGDDSKNWTISNIQFLDFDLSIGMFNGAGGVDAYNDTHITNNYMRMARDVATATDTAQNIAIHYSFGTNQVISGNTIDIQGDALTVGGNFAADIGMQCNTSGGNVYDGLQITNNTIHVLNAQSANPEVIIGIWENAHGHTSGITISGNSFTNQGVGNSTATNLQRGFRVTSHSSATTTVAYQNNTISGANIGMQWIAGSAFAGNQPVVVKSNTITGNGTGVLVQSQGLANLSFNRIVGNTVKGLNNVDGTVTAENNWWGCNAGPGLAGCDAVLGVADFNPWIVLGISAVPSSINAGGTSTATADMTHNSDAADTSGSGTVPLIPVAFSATQGTMTPPAGTITAGQAMSTFTSTSGSPGTACAMVDNQQVCTPIGVNAPSFAIDDVTHLEGDPPGTTSYVFTVTKTGTTALSSSVNFTTVNGTATLADSDYQLNSGTLNFGPTDTTMPITVLVNKDTNIEPDEAFTVHLDTPVNATISDADGTGTITNDDACAAFATVYVDDDWVGTVPGTDPDFGGPATNFGCDSFATIQGGVNGVTAGGTVIVRPGTYPESVLINKALTLNGAQVGANANTRFAAFIAGGPPNGPKANPAVESVITAAAVNPTSNVNNPIHVMANNVTIDGFVIDGNNPALPAGGSVAVVGINTDARRGIETEDAAGAFFAANNVTVQNNVIQNFAQRGVELVNPLNTSPATTGSLIHGNVVRVFGLDGIVLAFNACADITNNTVITPNYPTEAGIWLQDFGNGATPSAMTIANNNVTVGQDNFGGIWVNLAFLPSLNINNNTVNAAAGVTGASDFTYGIYLSSQRPGSTASLSGNIVGASGGEFSRGIALWNLGSATPTTVTGGTIGRSLKDLSLHDDDPNFGLAGGNSAVNTTGVSIDGTGVAGDIGIFVDATGSTGDTVAMEISGNTSIVNTTTAISVVGANASANIHNNAASIHDNTVGIDVDGGTATITSNNLYANATGLKLGAGSSVTAHFNRIISTTTAIDNPANATANLENNWWGCNAGPGNAGCGAVTGTGADFDPWIVLGVSATPSSIPPFGNSTITADMTKNSAGATPVGTLPDIPVAWSATNGTMAPPSGTVVAGTASSTFTSTSTISGTGCATVDNQLTCANVTVFPTTVTIVPAPVPTAADNDYTRINNAVQATFNGQTIKLLGTFNWTEPFAAASWSRGSNDIGGDLDDYSILVPGNIPNVTFTADNLGDGTIQGPGDLPGLDLEGVFFFNGDDSKNWTISNIQFLDFDLSIGMFNGAGGVDAYNDTHITNNYMRMARDVATATDTAQNIAIHYSFGTNQVISGNTIDIQGDALTVGGNFAADIGMQCNTSGGNVYDGLQITNNTIHVLNAQSANPEVIIGIWENAHAHTANITLSGNTFTNQGVGNNPATNLQRGFRVTSHSSATTTVLYQNNTVSGANIGFQWIAGSAFAGNQPVVVKSNTITGNGTGVLVQSQGLANLSFNRIVGNTVKGLNNVDGTVTAENNWWGCNAGPGLAGCDAVLGVADFNPWIVLGVSAVPTNINAGGTSTVTADMTRNSDGADTSGSGTVPPIPVAFTATQGTMTPPAGTITAGQAMSTFTSTSGSPGTACAMVDNQQVCTPIGVSAPSFSIDDVTHLEGDPPGTTSYVFTVTKTGTTALSSSVNFTTVNGTATLVDNDYQTNSGMLTFGPTDTTMLITVLVNRDTNFETNEAFNVHLSGAVNATISDADGTGTITNDDSPSISGHVAYDDSVTTFGKNVTMTLTGNNGFVTRTTTTDANGDYSFVNVTTGNDYTLTPSKAGDVGALHIESIDAAKVARFVAGLDVATPNQKIAADADGDTVLTSFDAALIARYVAGLPGTGIVGTWKFVPVNRTYPNFAANQTAQDFTAILVGDTDGNWQPALPAGGGDDNAQAGASAHSPDATLAVTVGLPHVTGPTLSNITVPITVGDLTGQGVRAYDLQITFDPAIVVPQGTPFDRAGTRSSGMLITPNATNPGHLVVSGFQTGDLSGPGTLINLKFTIVGAPGQVTSILFQDQTDPGTIFHPGSRFNAGTPAATISNGSVTVNGPTAASARISGQIVTADGQPVSGATVTVLGGPVAIRVITDSNGFYQVENLEVGVFYTVTPTRANFAFAPASRSFSLVGNRTDAVFTGMPISPEGNPLESPEFFVRQQYLDFLGREPEQSGLDYWSGQLRSCGNNPDCIATRRLDLSAAFFIAQEFQDSGLYIYDVYQGALGRRPDHAEYAVDRRSVVGGPRLEADKAAFATSFVERAEFSAQYPLTMSDEVFVDALLRTAQQSSGLALGASRAALVALYNTGTSTTESRSLVLRSVVEGSRFKQTQYNPAFVLMEYYGYLGRNPDRDGYDFWLNVLNSGDRNNYRGMVCSFITSSEYQQRFSAMVTRGNAECGRIAESKGVKGKGPKGKPSARHA